MELEPGLGGRRKMGGTFGQKRCRKGIKDKQSNTAGLMKECTKAGKEPPKKEKNKGKKREAGPARARTVDRGVISARLLKTEIIQSKTGRLAPCSTAFRIRTLSYKA